MPYVCVTRFPLFGDETDHITCALMSGMFISVRNIIIVLPVIINIGGGDPRKQVASETITLSEKMTSQATG